MAAWSLGGARSSGKHLRDGPAAGTAHRYAALDLPYSLPVCACAPSSSTAAKRPSERSCGSLPRAGKHDWGGSDPCRGAQPPGHLGPSKSDRYCCRTRRGLSDARGGIGDKDSLGGRLLRCYRIGPTAGSGSLRPPLSVQDRVTGIIDTLFIINNKRPCFVTQSTFSVAARR
jgi:hypothetical protein